MSHTKFVWLTNFASMMLVQIILMTVSFLFVMVTVFLCVCVVGDIY